MDKDKLLGILTKPSSVAVIGASGDKDKVGGRPVDYLKRFGFSGNIYPINPTRDVVQGIKCYPNLRALPETPDLAVIALAGPAVKAAVQVCAEGGVKAAVIMSSGFGETGSEGEAEQRQLIQIAAAAGMRMIGPNAQGVANFQNGMVANFSTMFTQLDPCDGPVAVVSQSGATGAAIYTMLRERGIGVRYVMTSGNEADITVSELALSILDDPGIRILVLYMESIKDPDLLAKAAALARTRGVCILAVKAGRSVMGAAAAQSHTGALAGEDRVVDAFLRRHSIWRADDISQISQVLPLYLKQFDRRRREVVVISNSGSSCVMSADIVDMLALPLVQLDSTSQNALGAVLASFATVTNPIDLTASLMTDSGILARVLDTFRSDESASLYLVSLPVAGQGYDLDRLADDIAAFEAQGNKLVVVSATLDAILAPFVRRGIVTFRGELAALQALDQVSRHQALLDEEWGSETEDTPLISLPGASSTFLSEAESLTALAAVGMPVVSHRLCATEDEVVQAWQAMESPIVLKGCSEKLPHKSEFGLVYLNLSSEQDVRKACQECESKMRALGLAPYFLVSPMMFGKRELALGAKVDPRFGPVVMLSDGGKFIESMPDYHLLVPPFSIDNACKGLKALRIAPLFHGARGEPPLPIECVAKLAVQLGDIMLRNEDSIASIDLNPVLVGPGHVVILDALIERKYVI